jgi:hypothetical protein
MGESDNLQGLDDDLDDLSAEDGETSAGADGDPDLDPDDLDDVDDGSSTVERIQRRLMSLLHDMVAEHIAHGDFEPSAELELAMENVRTHLFSH